MADGRRVDWRAVPTRYRRAMPTWRKLLWLVTRSPTMVVTYVAFAAVWYNAPGIVEGVGAGRESAWALVWLLGTQPELLVLPLLLVPAVVAGVLLSHKPAWY